MAAGYVNITIEEADDLVAKDLNGSSDPYAVIKLGNVTKKTRTQTATLKPKWNESFQLEFADDREALTISVYDYNRVTRDEIIGSIQIGMHDIPEEAGEPSKWYQLRSKGSKGETVGRIKLNLRVTFDDTFLSNFNRVDDTVEDTFVEEDFSLQGLVKWTMEVINQLYFLIEFYLYVYSLVTWEVPLSSAASWLLIIFLCMRPSFIPVLLPVPILVFIIKEYVATGGLGPDHRSEEPPPPSQSSGFFSAIKETTAWCRWFQNLMKWLAEQIIWFKELFQWRDYVTTLYIAYGCVGLMVLNAIIPLRFTILVLTSYVYFSNTLVYRGLYYLYCGLYSYAHNNIRLMMVKARSQPNAPSMPRSVTQLSPSSSSVDHPSTPRTPTTADAADASKKLK